MNWNNIIPATAMVAMACGPTSTTESLPTPEEQEEAIVRLCEQNLNCGDQEDYPVEECQDIRTSQYEVSSKCLETLYAYDSCIVELTCEELDFQMMFNEGDCIEERSEAYRLDDECRFPRPVEPGR